MHSKHKVRHEQPLTPDFSKPVPQSEGGAIAGLLREISKLNATIKKRATIENILVAQKLKDDAQISDLRALVFAGIKIPVTEAR